MRSLLHHRNFRFVLALALLAALVGVVAGGSVAAGKAPRTTLIVLEEDIVPALDYDGSSAAHPGAQESIENIMDPLLSYPSKKVGDILVPDYQVGASGFEPRLATSWTKKGLVWTFKLRKGVKSCAGNPLTADDVVYTFARAKSVSGAAPIGWFLGNVAGVFSLAPVLPKATAADKRLGDEVTKIDDHTVQIKQLNANELFPRVLEIFALYIYDSKEMKKHATAADPWTHKYTETTNSPGFGAYCLSKWTKGSEIQFTANPGYFGPKPQFTKVIVRKVPSTSNRIAALRSGQADVTIRLTPTEYESMAKTKGVKVLSFQNTKVVFFGLSYKFAPWNGPKNRLLRQAVAYALPYDDIIKSDYKGNAKRWYGPCESSYYGYVKNTTYQTDVAKAKALMAQAGYPGGKGLDSSGLVLYFTAGSVLEPLANRIRTALAGIGINVSLSPLSISEYSDRRLTKFDMPLFLDDQDRPLGPDIGYCSLLWYVSKANGGLVTDSSYANPAFDALYKKSSLSVGAPRLATLKKMQEVLMSDLPKIPIVEPASQFAVRSDITGFQGTSYDWVIFSTLRTTS